MTPPPKKPEEEKVYIGIPKYVMPLLIGLAATFIVFLSTMVFSLFKRVSDLETTSKQNIISPAEYIQLKIEHQQLMEDRKQNNETNRKVLEWVESQQRHEKIR